MEHNELKNSIEAILFAASGPVEIKKLTKSLRVNEEELQNLLSELNQDYQQRHSGLTLIFDNQKAEMTTSAAFSNKVKEFIQEDLQEELTSAALETMAIIGYRGPLSKPEIDNLRGVNSYYILRQLLIRGLIERISNPQKHSSFIYKLSFDFLKYLGFNNAQDLPEYETYHSKIVVTENNNQETQEQN